MNLIARCFSSLSAALIAALWVVPANGNDDIVRVEHNDFVIVHHASLPQPAVDEIVSRTERALRQVSAWLQQAESWQGSPYANSKLRVLIDPEEFTPSQMRSTIYVPGMRVVKAFDEDRLAQGDFGIVHEVTHVLAESAYRGERNRFYDDGLAVFLQQKFGPVGNYPVRGPDIHVATALLAASYGELIPLDECDQARRESGERRRLGYLQLGSFTQYLVENFGVDAYMQIYHGADLADITGLSMQQLEVRWRQLIQSL